MNRKRITTGISLLFIGVILLLSHFDIISFNWLEIISYWPLFIILAGVQMLSPKDKQLGQIISIGTTVAILGFLTYVGLSAPKQSLLDRFLNSENIAIYHDDEKNDSTKYTSQNLVVPFDQKIQKASLNIDLGATTLRNTAHTSTHLFSAYNTSKDFMLGLKTKSLSEDEIEINIKGKESKIKKTSNNKTILSLNPNVIWKLNFDIGAIDAKLDLSNYKVERVDIDAGATSLNLKLGQPLATTKVKMDTGASSIEIFIPKGAACRIISDNALSSTDYEGDFVKVNGQLKSADYESAAKKFDFDIDGGIASIKIRRY